MRGTDGELSDGTGVFPDAVPEQRLVVTNAFAPGRIPAGRLETLARSLADLPGDDGTPHPDDGDPDTP